jgi:hypothetical protein
MTLQAASSSPSFFLDSAVIKWYTVSRTYRLDLGGWNIGGWNSGMYRTNRPGPKQERRQLSAPRYELPLGTSTELRPLSNRHTLELEIELSYRKQRIGPLSNRHKIAFCERVAFTLSRVEGSPLSASSASCASSAPRTSCPAPKLLDSALNYRKYSTSQFLIDNFGWSFASHLFPTSKLGPRTSSSNRPAPRLEMPVSQRKQKIGPLSNRPQIAVFNFDLLRASVAQRIRRGSYFRLSTNDPQLRPLIANETHSRAESSLCKQSAYEILIANEFHSRISPHERFFYPEAESVLTAERRVADSVRGASNQR